MKRYILQVIISMTVFSAVATEKESISFSALGLQGDTPLNEENGKNLTVKLQQIIAYNNAGAKTSQSRLFVIYPEFVVTNSDIVNTGMRNIYVIRGELSLFSRNLTDDNTFSTVVLRLEGSGKSEQDCYRTMINSVKGSNPKVTGFIKESQQRVIEYYDRIMPQVLAKAQKQISSLEYEDALATLSIIPECVDEYMSVSELMSRTYMNMLDRDATLKINKAKLLVAKKEYLPAMDTLSTVDPLSNHYGEACSMIESATLGIQAAERAEAERRVKEMKMQREREDQIRRDNLELQKQKLSNDDKKDERVFELAKLSLAQKQAKEYADREAAKRIESVGVSNGSNGKISGFKQWFVDNFLK